MRRFLLVLVVFTVACASQQRRPEPTVCPESRGLFCLTQKICSFDRDRGCEVCQCSNAQSPPMRPPDAPVPQR